ncbi:MAG: protein-L-isoaspartate O-methyltransferase [Rhodospirillaceae bacterium]|nr:protein-L-isoaspartate O-methyltransferase [Rhodospirillaceae bacterium]
MDFAAARHYMVEGQVRTNRVTDSLLVDAMDSIAREEFLPEALKSRAYIDEDINVAPGRIMMEPMVLARMLQTAEIKETDLCMACASATGYEAACMAAMASAVVAIESNVDLAASSEEALKNIGADTVSVLKGDITKGHPAQAPFDVIFINGAVSEIPETLINQLAEGGRLLAVVAPPGSGIGKATLVTMCDDVVSERQVFDANVPGLPEFTKAATFSF